jgi:hypothetical protein
MADDLDKVWREQLRLAHQKRAAEVERRLRNSRPLPPMSDEERRQRMGEDARKAESSRWRTLAALCWFAMVGFWVLAGLRPDLVPGTWIPTVVLVLGGLGFLLHQIGDDPE